jgi:hypothetical protein
MVVAVAAVHCASHDQAQSASHPAHKVRHRATLVAAAGAQSANPPPAAPTGLSATDAATRAQSVVWDNLVSARGCYKRLQRKFPGDPGGSVACTVSFKSGDATNYVSCEGSARGELRECVANVIRSLSFERPASGVVYFKTPMRFSASN